MSNLRVAVVCIARLEGRYLPEFFEHYKSLGFSNVILCDNDHDGDEEDVEAIIKPYSGFVIYEGYRNKEGCQVRAYTDVYEKYKNDYDWFFYCDVDEMLVLNKHKTIQEFLSTFTDCQAVVINWKCFTDSGLIEYDPRPMMERFGVPMDKNKCVQYADIAENMHVKSFVKGGLENMSFYSNPHVPTTPLVTYNASGKRCSNSPFQPIDWDVACLNHYVTKSLEEYCFNKLKRGSGDRSYDLFLKTYGNRYFRYNTVTQEKLDWLKEHGFQGI